MYCKKCGNEIFDEAVVCPHCGCAVNGTQNPVVAENAKVSGACIVGFILSLVSFFISFYCIIPVLGLIFSIVGVVQASNKGKKCKGLGVAGIVLSVLSLIINLILLLAIGSIINMIINLA